MHGGLLSLSAVEEAGVIRRSAQVTGLHHHLGIDVASPGLIPDLDLLLLTIHAAPGGLAIHSSSPRHSGGCGGGPQMSGSSGQEPETVVEPGGDLVDGQGPGPSRGEFEGKRDAVEVLHGPDHRREVVFVQQEPRPRGGDPLGEQADGVN